ncbi:hypothetical protein MNBD_GAMMA16-366 [hydrothermal vent metagenome]|uniref:Uncharacterized protein n=1 Tax=hydrothermal vent metagenome TaxID=652676 RepID=A0A3B1A0J7_9ZZZZ
MDDIQKLLYDKIMEFDIGPEEGGRFFIERLYRENLWDWEYCSRCILEYRKFVYLAMISEQEVTPSDEVDQVWHLHLLYTKSYWSELCQNTLSTSLHHMPTNGGNIESMRFEEQYQYTLDKYLETFGEYPPADIWPNTDKRFKNADKFVRVNSKRYNVKKRPYKNIVFILSIIIFVISLVQDSMAFMLFMGSYIVIRMIEWLFDAPDRIYGRCRVSASYEASGGSGGCGGCG